MLRMTKKQATRLAVILGILAAVAVAGAVIALIAVGGGNRLLAI